MITLVKYIVNILITILILMSCKNDNSLQQFMVKNQEKPEAISFDLSTDLLSLKENNNTPENVEILKSIKKTNVLAFKLDTLNKATYEKEKIQLKKIFENDKYQELMRFGKGSNAVKVYSVGTENAIDEFIIYANDNSKGWGIVRVTGENMQPDKILGLMSQIQLDKDNAQLINLTELFK